MKLWLPQEQFLGFTVGKKEKKNSITWGIEVARHSRNAEFRKCRKVTGRYSEKGDDDCRKEEERATEYNVCFLKKLIV